MSEPRPVVGTAEALRDVLALARDLASERCEYGELPDCACHRCRSRRALDAFRERRPLHEDETVVRILRRVQLKQVDVYTAADDMGHALLGSPAPQGGCRG